MDRRTGIAVASVVLAIVLLAIGAYSGDDDDTSYFLIASAITIAVAVVLFWVIVPRVTRPGLGGLIIGVLAIVSLVFWVGLPAPLAGATAVLGLTARESGSEVGKGTAALALAAVAVVAAVVVAFIG